MCEFVCVSCVSVSVAHISLTVCAQGELESAIERGIEGLIVKEASLAYRPDARHWWKLKRDYLEGMADTVDLLLLGAYQGSGMRGGQLASFLMGCLARPAKVRACTWVFCADRP